MAFGAVFGGFVLSAEPGGAADPIVTQSYVHQHVERAIADALTGMGGGVQAAEPFIFQPVHVMAGHVILGHEGTEIILRSGSGVAHVTVDVGIANVTAGVDLLHGAAVAQNNLLIVPRTDGRGVRTTSDSWFLVKGDFDIIIAP